MNDFFECREPLKLSDEQLRIELDRDRDRDLNLAQNYSKCTGVPTELGIWTFDVRRKIRDLELIIKPSLDPEFWSSLLMTQFQLVGRKHQNRNNISMMSNIILCALVGRGSYQDPDGTWHIPLYCDEQRYHWLIGSSDMSAYQLAWYESSPEELEYYPFLVLRENPLKIINGLLRTKKVYSRVVMLLIRFEKPTLLEKVVLNDEVFQESRICSVDFMESKIYGIILDSRIKDWTQLSEQITNYVIQRSLINFPPGVIISNHLRIDLETNPPSIPEIRAFSLHYSMGSLSTLKIDKV